MIERTGDLRSQTGRDIADPSRIAGRDDQCGEEADGVSDRSGLHGWRNIRCELRKSRSVRGAGIVQCCGVGLDIGDGVQGARGEGGEGVDDLRGNGGQIGWLGGFGGEELDEGLGV